MSGRALRADTLRAAPTSSIAATYFSSAAFSSPATNSVLPSVWSGVARPKERGRTERVLGECCLPEDATRCACLSCLYVCGLRQVGKHRTSELGQCHGHCPRVHTVSCLGSAHQRSRQGAHLA